jgi:hypothetical protein
VPVLRRRGAGEAGCRRELDLKKTREPNSGVIGPVTSGNHVLPCCRASVLYSNSQAGPASVVPSPQRPFSGKRSDGFSTPLPAKFMERRVLTTHCLAYVKTRLLLHPKENRLLPSFDGKRSG